MKKIGAISLVLGSFLNMIRMIPIYMEVGLDGYPPKNLAETVEIAQLNGYVISHLMVFFATPLFLLGYFALYKGLKKSDSNSLLTLSLIGFTIGQVFYTLGVVLHGVVLPEMAHEFAAASASDQAAMTPLFDFNHHIATSLGGLGFAFCLVATGFLGIPLIAKSKVLGFTAITIGMVALIGYTTGILAILLFKGFMVTAGFITAMFVFYFVIGIFMLKSPEFDD